ncbi:dephospho-CoA kinase [Campylobacter blaseri]|uniref:Dephospho-CoA kinase n=1 Tax=Campylobacter blaseri TaxID=2042961 RepID=A0A2P8R3C5_9BACT|nr:dephospho-CoA kinase [Campylobacter blaseri]PSM52988.1 dephospho-CoA kinase [Campylobacter blaseri]PSM54455.1 dephospho-CoA kinase [Campylobacter blaseri]QKF85301.1 dephospho-CoA kinase [Campylobacter blaseri]
MKSSREKYFFGVVITGNIGSGKSSVCDILKQKGYDVIDADKISHKALDEISQKIALEFGDEFVINGIVDRKQLGKLVFSDKNLLKKLEDMLSFKIESEIYRQANIFEENKKLYFLDIPLYFESKKYKEFDKILLVYATKDILIKRVMKRNSLSKDEVLKRLNLQIDIEEKKVLSTYIIDNSGDLEHLENLVSEFLQKLKEDYADI